MLVIPMVARPLLVLGLCLTLFVTYPVQTVRAATSCFRETGHCIGEPFIAFWQENGALPVLGIPLAPMSPETNRDTGGVFLVQWFERQRLEVHPELEAPYNISLGRLGAERLERLGRDWRTFPQAQSGAAHYYATTGHAIAPQFWAYWRGHGLDLGDASISERESLALFGYPLSEPAMERNAEGDTVLTQWFERARFEYHPQQSEPNRIMLGLLGVEVAPPTRAVPFYEDRLGVAETLVSYYNAVNRKEYRRAYSYWETPGTSPTSTPPDFETFARGYAQTADVAPTIGTARIDSGVGNVWAAVPVFLRATTTDGAVQTFAGCYVLHHTNPGADPRPDAALWKLSRAQITAARSDATPAAVLSGTTCDAAAIPAPQPVEPQVVTLRVADAETYRIRLTDEDDISIARQLLRGETAPKIPNGQVIRGFPDVNVGYSWHIDPTSLEFVDATVEVCDGRPSDVEQHRITSARYCPWSAKIIGIEPLRP